MAQYDVHCWGQSNPADTERDFDATRFLAHSVMLACTLLAQTSMELTPGEWIDQQEGAAQMVKAGHRFRFGVTLHMPVADSSVQRTKPGTVLGQPTIAVTHGVTA